MATTWRASVAVCCGPPVVDNRLRECRAVAGQPAGDGRAGRQPGTNTRQDLAGIQIQPRREEEHVGQVRPIERTGQRNAGSVFVHVSGQFHTPDVDLRMFEMDGGHRQCIVEDARVRNRPARRAGQDVSAGVLRIEFFQPPGRAKHAAFAKTEHELGVGHRRGGPARRLTPFLLMHSHRGFA